MGTKIVMVSVLRPLFRFLPAGSIKLSSRVAKDCLTKAGLDPCDIGLLINSGIYRHKNTGEPSVASMVQKKIGVNSNKLFAFRNRPANCKNTFSFDLNNGGCGLLTGIQIADGFLQTGDIKHAMVITGDSDPFYGFSENFVYEPAAAAMILSGSENKEGFSHFRTYTYSCYNDELISSTRYDYFKGKGRKRNILSFRQKETYLDKCIECAAESLNLFLDETELSLEGIDLVITSQSPQAFISGMKRRTGITDKFVEVPGNGNKELQTAGPAFALKKTWDDNSFYSSKTILFLTVGSGISISFALYKN
jgi:3-oxoacyl-[acyl-carrier-protein] synthase-3